MPASLPLVAALLAAALALPGPARAEPATPPDAPRLTWRGNLYDVEAAGEPLAFRFLQWESADGRRMLSAYHAPDGRLLTTESLLLDDRGLVRYEVHHLEAQVRGIVERVGERVRLTTTRPGKTRTREDRFDDRLVVGLVLPRFIERHWSALASGETVIARYPLFDRVRVIDLRIRRDGVETRNGEELVVMELAPKSRLLALLANPVRMRFGARDHAIREVIGRAVPLRHVGGSWVPMEARGVYERVSE